MQFVVVLDVPDEAFDGDDSIEVACRRANEVLREPLEGEPGISVRPLSEVIAC